MNRTRWSWVPALLSTAASWLRRGALGQPLAYTPIIRSRIDPVSGAILRYSQVDTTAGKGWLESLFQKNILEVRGPRLRMHHTLQLEQGDRADPPRLTGVAVGEDGRVAAVDAANAELILIELARGRLEERRRVALDYQPEGVCRLDDRLVVLEEPAPGRLALRVHDLDGREIERVPLDDEGSADGAESSAPRVLLGHEEKSLLVVVPLDGAAVRAFRPDGRRAWTFRFPERPSVVRLVASTPLTGGMLMLEVEGAAEDTARYSLDAVTGELIAPPPPREAMS